MKARAGVRVKCSLQAADRLLKYLVQLRKGPALVPHKLWWVLLQSLTDIARLDPRLTVRKAAIESTFALLGDEAGVAEGALDGEFGARVFRELLLPLLGPPAAEQDAASLTLTLTLTLTLP